MCIYYTVYAYIQYIIYCIIYITHYISYTVYVPCTIYIYRIL